MSNSTQPSETPEIHYALRDVAKYLSKIGLIVKNFDIKDGVEIYHAYAKNGSGRVFYWVYADIKATTIVLQTRLELLSSSAISNLEFYGTLNFVNAQVFVSRWFHEFCQLNNSIASTRADSTLTAQMMICGDNGYDENSFSALEGEFRKEIVEYGKNLRAGCC